MLINIRLERDLKHYLALLLILLLISSGCSSSKLDPKVRQQQADSFAVYGGLVQEKIQTNQFFIDNLSTI